MFGPKSVIAPHDLKKSNPDIPRLVAVFVMVVSLGAIGCSGSRMFHRDQGLFSKNHATFGPDAQLTDIVAHLNQTSSQVHCWRSTDATVHVSGLAVPLKAMIAVEEPMQARLVVSNPLGQQEFQAGSNQQVVWTWERRDEEKKIVTIAQDEVSDMIAQSGLPFSPEWLMQVLGLTELDATQLKLERTSTDPNTVYLTENITLGGRTYRKQTVVDLQKGVIVGHNLYDQRSTLILTASVRDYRKTDQAGVIMPVEYEIRMPMAQQGMKITLNALEINPTSIDSTLWDVPQMNGYHVVALHPQEQLKSIPSISPQGRGEFGLPDRKMITEYDLRDPARPLTNNRVVELDRPELIPQQHLVYPVGQRTQTGEATLDLSSPQSPTQQSNSPSPWDQWSTPAPPSQPIPSAPPTNAPEPTDDLPEWAR